MAEQVVEINGEKLTIEYMADDCPNNCRYCAVMGFACIYEAAEEAQYKEASDADYLEIFGGENGY